MQCSGGSCTTRRRCSSGGAALARGRARRACCLCLPLVLGRIRIGRGARVQCCWIGGRQSAWCSCAPSRPAAGGGYWGGVFHRPQWGCSGVDEDVSGQVWRVLMRWMSRASGVRGEFLRGLSLIDSATCRSCVFDAPPVTRTAAPCHVAPPFQEAPENTDKAKRLEDCSSRRFALKGGPPGICTQNQAVIGRML